MTGKTTKDSAELREQLIHIVAAEKSQDTEFNSGIFYEWDEDGKRIKSRLMPDQINNIIEVIQAHTAAQVAAALIPDREKIWGMCRALFYENQHQIWTEDEIGRIFDKAWNELAHLTTDQKEEKV